MTVWLVPSVSVLVSVITLFYGLFFEDGARRFFRDSDTGWHIRTGERILAGQPLPRTDPFSFSKADQPWLAWEWGADVAMGAAHRANGLRGVALLFAGLTSVCVWLWFQAHWKCGGNFFFACVMAVPMLTSVSLHWLARPHVFGWVFCLILLAAFENATDRFGPLHALAFFALGTLWANVHASFFLLPLFAVLYAFGALLNKTLWNDHDPRWPWFLKAALCGLLGTFCNPYGWRLHGHVAAYLGNTELLARVGEFQSFNFHAAGAWQVVIMVLIAAVGGALALPARRPEHFLLAMAVLAMALRSARTLPLAALLLLPLANGAITKALERAGMAKSIQRALADFLRYSNRLLAFERRAGGYALVPLALLVALVAAQSAAFGALAGFPPDEFPVKAASAVENLPAEARLLAPDKFGGYLIYRFDGRRKVFFDGRSDFYGAAFMKEYIRLVEVRPGWRDQVNRHGFTHALLPNNYSLLEALEQWGWKRLYRDDTATLVARN